VKQSAAPACAAAPSGRRWGVGGAARAGGLSGPRTGQGAREPAAPQLLGDQALHECGDRAGRREAVLVEEELHCQGCAQRAPCPSAQPPCSALEQRLKHAAAALCMAIRPLPLIGLLRSAQGRLLGWSVGVGARVPYARSWRGHCSGTRGRAGRDTRGPGLCVDRSAPLARAGGAPAPPAGPHP